MPTLRNSRHGHTPITEPAAPGVKMAGAGQAGIHANQNNRHHKAGRTSRVSTRSAQMRAVLRHEYS